jgi:hypothetical protein
MAVRDDPERSNRTGFRWDPAYAAVVVTLLGGVAYTVFRLAYALFYGRLGAVPEEVGLGYGQTLVRGVIPALTVGAMVLFAVGYMISMALSIVRQLPEIRGVIAVFRRRHNDKNLVKVEGTTTTHGEYHDVLRALYPRAASELEKRGLSLKAIVLLIRDAFKLGVRAIEAVRSAPYSALSLPWPVYTGPVMHALKNRITAAIVVLLVLVGLPFLAWYQAGLVATGKLPNEFLSAVTGITVQKATLLTADPTKPLEPPLKDNKSVLYLGASGGAIVLYDYNAKDTVRVNSSNVIVVTGSR